jgi:hypothetical protein
MDDFSEVTPFPGRVSSDHIPFCTEIIFNIQAQPIHSRKTFVWKIVDYKELNTGIEKLELDSMISMAPLVTDLWVAWKENLMSFICDSVLHVKIKSIDIHPWIDNEVKPLARRKGIALKKAYKVNRQS